MPARAPSMMISQASLTSLQRAHRAGEEAEDGAAAQLLRPADDRRGHVDHLARAEARERADGRVLGRVAEDRLGVVQRRRVRRHVVGAERPLDHVDLRQCVDDPGAVGDVLLATLVQLAGVRIDDLDALAEVGEADPAVLEHDVPGRVAAAHDDGGGRRADRVLHEVRRQAHDVRLAVDLGAGRREDLAGLVVFDEDARARQHFERRAVDLPQLVVGEHLEPEAAALARSRARVPDHVSLPPCVP